MPTRNTREFVPTESDEQIKRCLEEERSFSIVAGAGSGKTTSLVMALDHIRTSKGKTLRQNEQKIACITFTNRAVDVISKRLGWDDIFLVSTLHSFLWGEIKRFTIDIRAALTDVIIPTQLEKQAEKAVGNSQRAEAARQKIESLNADLEALVQVEKFLYDDTSTFSNYSEGKLSHDDVVAISGSMISDNAVLRKVLGQKYPYIFVDEAQDTFAETVNAFNSICSEEGLPVVGYFGDPWQQIYDRGTGEFAAPEGSPVITKQENYRCTPQVIKLLNSFRTDVEQVASGDNAAVEGSVELILVQSESPEAPRNRYSDEQLDRAATKFDQIIRSFGWEEDENTKLLFLVRQMIARRLGFQNLHKLFTGEYASSRAQEDYESGDHKLLKPFTKVLWPLVESYRNGDIRTVINLLAKNSPAFNPEGENEQKSLREMLELGRKLVEQLTLIWDTNNLGTILQFVRDNGLYRFSESVLEDLDREPMEEEYCRDEHSQDKGRWLADTFFTMDTSELANYVDFVNDNTPFSTQHGVKGEEYPNVVVVFDDTEAAWNLYSFSKLLTPGTSGEATEGQLERSRKLAYVCFSRAEENLRIILFTPNPKTAKEELIGAGLLSEEQVVLVE